MSKSNSEQIVAGQQLEVVIDEMGHRGQGRVRLDDRWLSVAGALPGEKVMVEVRQLQQGTEELWADVVEVIEPSPNRRNPLCERDRECQGCQLRHLTVAAELEYKVEMVQKLVQRHAGVAMEDQPDVEMVTPQPIARGDAFRIRTRLQYRRCGEGFELGLETPVQKELIPMDDCPALTGPTKRLVATIVDTLQRAGQFPPDAQMVSVDGADNGDTPGLGEIRVVSPTHGVGLVDIGLVGKQGAEFERQIVGDVYGPWLKALAEAVPDNVGVAVRSDGHRVQVVPPDRIIIPFGKWQMEVGYDDWIHTTLEPGEEIYRRMLDWLQLKPSDRVLDVGCGTGTITLMTSQQAGEVVGLDVNAASIEAAEINAVGHGRENVEFVVGGWQRTLRQLAMDDEQFTVATINPMDEPLGRRSLAFLQRLGVDRLVYLGPSPQAAARDIGELLQMEWSLQKLAAGNLHPATYHTPLMAALERK